MNRKLMDYIRAESQCNYVDILDYFTELNQCDNELKAKYLADLVWFIANTENLDDEEFETMWEV